MAFHSVRVVDGTVRLRLPASDIDEMITGLALTFRAQAEDGSFSVQGGLTTRGLDLTLKGTLGAPTADPSRALSLSVDFPAGGVRAEYTGSVGVAPLALSGTLGLGIDNASRLAQTLAQRLNATLPALPLPLDGKAGLNARLSAAPDGLALDDLVIRVGPTEARGSLGVSLGAVPRLSSALRLTRLDLDAWTRLGPGHETTSAPPPPPEAPDGLSVPLPAPEATPAFTLPTALEASLDLSADAVLLKGSALRDVAVTAQLAKGTLSLPRLKARLPGASDLEAQGRLVARDGKPVLEAGLTATSNDLRALLAWAGFDARTVPGERLRALDLQASLTGSPDLIRLTSLTLTLDTTTVRGAAVLRPGERPGLGLTLIADTLNLDAYRPSPPPRAPGLWLAGLDGLNALDANLDLRVGRLIVGEETLEGVSLQGSLIQGRLNLTQGGVARALGGAALTLTGGLSGFGGQPTFHGFGVGVTVPTPARTLHALRLASPAFLTEGPLAVSAVLDGPLGALSLDSTTHLADLDLQVSGTLNNLVSGLPTIDLGLDLAHPDTQALVRTLAPETSLRGPLGPLRFQGQLSGGVLSGLSLKNIEASVGPTQVTGTLDLTVLALRPRLSGQLQSPDLDLTPFLPVQRAAALLPSGRLPPRAFTVIPVALTSSGPATPWPDTPLALDALGLVNATVTLDAGRVRWDTLVFETPSLDLQLEDGVLTLTDGKARIGGGSLLGKGRLSVAPVPGWTLDLEGRDIALDQAGPSALARGRLGFDLALTAQGASVRAVVGSLAGTGRLDLKQADWRGEPGTGRGLSVILEALGLINRVTGAPGTDVSGPLTIERGVVAFDPLTLGPHGRLTGALDLATWSITAAGHLPLEGKTPLKGVKLPDPLPVTVSGSLDRPVIRVASLPATPRPQDDDPVPAAAPVAPRPVLETLPPPPR
ncbi:AsmA family protein [Pararhodospirillum photometricum]|uniref:AsmA n=1 Tax=Pararhodospirillum photometricum DSM 122 TaxID=1150469 RepID=H6SK56_PARPM|nr:AsmA family protein [Pararhodospirillum photometricum]CCG08371.1 AsmA [Pararhodospirillum photometricum DSM 122]